MKPFGDRRTDFGHSDIIAPRGRRYVTIYVVGEPWRVELDKGEQPTPELIRTLERQAEEYPEVVRIIEKVYKSGARPDSL